MLNNDSGRLISLAKESWRQYGEYASKIALEDSIPVLFFGKLDAYWSPFPKVITLGRNPSKEEFPGRQLDFKIQKCEKIT